MELLFHLFGSAPLSGDILQSERLLDLLADANLLADGIDEMELDLWKHDGEGNAWESTSSTEVHDACSRLEANQFGYGETVEDMMFVKVVDVLPRDDIYLAVPIVIEVIKSPELEFLLFAQVV